MRVVPTGKSELKSDSIEASYSAFVSTGQM
jgi:hypothetical protein